jgi:acyl transferase domain-containing protein/phosphopantetheinyl transferase
MNTDKDIAVVGMACVFPKAANLRQFWSNLVNGVDAIDSPPPGRWSDRRNFQLPAEHEAFLPSDRGGFLPTDLSFDPLPFGVQPNLVRHGDPDQFLMLHVIDAALRDAGIAEDSPLRKRTDVIIGRGGYVTGKLLEVTFRAECFDIMLELLERRYPEWVRPRRPDLEEYLRSTLTPREADNVSTAIANITASRAANRLNLRGAAYTVDGACASSLLAVEQAVWRLRNGQSDAAVAAGVFLNLAPTFLHAFASIGALSASGSMRPFDRRADGLLAGEGGGAVILKRLEDAIQDGNEIYALVKGVGSASDGREVDVLAPSSSGQVLALENAYADAGIDPASIGYLELHGTATVVGDLTELATIKTFFGTVTEPATARAMGSVKSMIGHCMPAAGIAAFIKTALALANKILPPSLHCEEPRRELSDSPFYLITQTRPWIHNPAHGPRRAGVNAFGFGGINAHVVLEEWIHKPGAPATGYSPVAGAPGLSANVRPIETGLHRASELFVISAESEDALRQQLRRLDHFLDHDGTEPSLTDLAWTLSRAVRSEHPFKLAIVADDLPHLRRLLHECLDGPNEETDTIYYSADARTPRGKIAFLFPGMGFPGLIGNYPDHVLELCLHYPEVRAEFDFFEDRDRHPEDKVPTSAIFSPPLSLPEEYRRQLKSRLAPPKAEDYSGDQPAPRERYLAAMGVTLSNWASWVLLRKFDIPVDMIAGQSQGEMAALCAAGVANFHAVAPGFWKVLNIDARVAIGRQLAFTWASEEKVAPLLAEEADVHVAIHMAPHSVILGGKRESLLRIAEKLRQEEILVQLLPYPPIHTPCLSHLRGQLLEQLADEKVELHKPGIALYSSITSELYPDDAAGMRETLLKNVDQPLRVWQTVRRMYEDGARIFVQVGGGHMAAHLNSILPEGEEAITVAVDVDTRNPLTQLNHLCAGLFRTGVPLRLEPLFAHRCVRMLDLDRPQPAPRPSRFAVPLRIDWTPLQHENAQRCSPSPPTQVPEGERGQPQSIAFELPEEARRMPVLGRVTHFLPEREIVIERTLDLEEDLYLHDHLFIYAECKPLEERLPILPLTMSLEFAAESAALLSPGLGLIGFENVRGLRWIGLRDGSRTDLRIESRVESPSLPIPLPSGERGDSSSPLSPLGRGVGGEGEVQRVHCTIFLENQASFTADVLFAQAYRQDLADPVVDSSNEDRWPIEVERIYGDRLMFHGPRFQTMLELHTLGNPGASAALRAMPRDGLFASHPDPLLLTDPCLLDGVGQFVGLWARMHERFILPISVDKIEFYSPPPPAETVCPVRMEIIAYDADARQMRFNIELEDGAGGVCARFQGWTDWIVNWPMSYQKATMQPQYNVLSEEIELPGLPQGSVCMLATRDSFTGTDLDWAARFFLHRREMPGFSEAASNERRREYLVSRAAVKDAVRTWWSRKHGTDLPHPAEFAIEHDEQGRPFFLGSEEATLPYLSIAHTSGSAVAIVSDRPVGIDLESAGRDTRSILAEFTTGDERALLERLAPLYAEENVETRLWCAKEAVGKALGMGLNGRPKDFEAIDHDEKGSFLIHHVPTGERLVVRSARLDSFLFAWTARSGGASGTTASSQSGERALMLFDPRP